MPRLVGGREGWGAVDHPETGELVQLDESHPKDVAETVAAHYEWLAVEDEDGDFGELTCGVEKSDGSPCQRSVESAGETCWQHTKDESA